MEKIYTTSETKRKKQTFFGKNFKGKGTIVATLLVAIAGIAGLVAFGFNQISFAAPDKTGAALTETFKGVVGDPSEKVTGGTLPVLGFKAELGDGTLVPVFCTQYNVNYGEGKTYTRGAEINDQGLIYLASQLYPNKTFKDKNGNELDEMAQVWITQAAIWSYLYEVGDPNNSNFGKPDTNNYVMNDSVKKASVLYKGPAMTVVYETENGIPVFDELGITKLIATAKQYRTKPFTTLTVNKKSDTISMTNDKKYYQTDIISVVGSTSSPLINSFEGYDVYIKNAPEGTKLIDESGKEISLDGGDLSESLSPTTKFYVRVPVDKVTDKNKKVQISVNGYFKMYGANEYAAEGYQKVINVGVLNRFEMKPLEFELNYTPKVPNTGMSPAQIIYFMGLILLLSGVGILYVNSKPAKNN